MDNIHESIVKNMSSVAATWKATDKEVEATTSNNFNSAGKQGGAPHETK